MPFIECYPLLGLVRVLFLNSLTKLAVHAGQPAIGRVFFCAASPALGSCPTKMFSILQATFWPDVAEVCYWSVRTVMRGMGFVNSSLLSHPEVPSISDVARPTLPCNMQVYWYTPRIVNWINSFLYINSISRHEVGDMCPFFEVYLF